MPVSLCEWRVRIGTFVHWIRAYEIRERKERLLKERTRRVKVLCERLKAKMSDSQLEAHEDDSNARNSRQEGSYPTKGRQCPHKTDINSSGNFDIKELLTSCDQCIHDLLTPSHCCSKDLLSAGGEGINELLKHTDSSVKDLVAPDDCCIKDLFTSVDCGVKDLITSDGFSARELITPDDYSLKTLLTTEECSFKDLITPHGCSVKDLNTLDDCSVKDLITPDDCSLKTLLTAEVRSVKDLITPHVCSVNDLTTSDYSSVKDLITPDDCCLNDLLTAEEWSVKDLITRDDCSVKDHITPDDFSARDFSRTTVGGNGNVMVEDISRPFRNDERRGKTKEHGRSTSLCHGQSLKSKTALIPEQTPPISELLLLKSGDVELNPGPREWPDLELERELMSLFAEISPQYYTILCNSLGVGQAGSEAILTKNLLNVPKSLFEIICSWGLKQRDGTNYKEVLADKLRSVHLDALGTKLLEGRYLPPENSLPASASDEGKHTSQLTQEQVNRCAQDFKTFYRTYLCKIMTDPLDFNCIFEFEKIYTNLVLLRNEAGKQLGTPLEYENLLRTKVNNELSKRLMVEGEGGAGKTTFCSKIAWDWCNGCQEFQQFEWVLLIPMRDIQDGQTVGEIVKGYLSDSNTVRPEDIDKYILAEPSKVFIIFDGLDEYSGGIIKHGSDIAKILRSEKFEECTVLVTARPWKADQIKSNQEICKPYSFIEVQGLSSNNVSSYVMKYFADDENTGVQLIKFIEDNDVMKENMAPFPIYVSMLCILWRDSTSERRDMICKLKTFSQLFEQMIMFLKYNYVSKLHKRLEEKFVSTVLDKFDNFFTDVGAIAFTGLLKQQLSFNEDLFSSCHEAMEACCRIGVLSREDRVSSRWKRSRNIKRPVTSCIFFPHKLFQEYVSALYLASLYNLNREEYGNAMRNIFQDDPRKFRYLLYFTASQANDVGLDIISQLMANLSYGGYDDDDDDDDDYIYNNKHMHNNEHLLVDVTFETHDATLGKTVGQQILPEGKTLTIEEYMSAHTFSGYLFIMEKCAMNTLVIRDKSCGPTVSRDLADILSSSSSLKTLKFVRTSFHDDFYLLLKHVSTVKIEKSINSVQELHIDHVFINELKKFDISIETLFPSLKQLHLNALQTVSPSITKRLAHSSLSMFKIALPDSDEYDDSEKLEEDEYYPVPLSGEPDSLKQLFSISFPLLTNLTFENIVIGNIRCEAILRSLRNHTHIKVIRVIRCFTDDELDSLASEISAENSIEITLQHDPQQNHLNLTGLSRGGVLSPGLMDALCHRTCVRELYVREILDRTNSEELILDMNGREADSKIQHVCIEGCNPSKNDPTASRDLARFLCRLPCLTNLTIKETDDEYLDLFLHDDFYHEIARLASSSKIERVSIGGCNLEQNDPTASRDLARFLCLLPCLTDLTIKGMDGEYQGMNLHGDFYHEIARLASSSKNYFFATKLSLGEKTEDLKEMDLGRLREYIGHLIRPTSIESPSATSRPPKALSLNQQSVQQRVASHGHPKETKAKHLQNPNSIGPDQKRKKRFLGKSQLNILPEVLTRRMAIGEEENRIIQEAIKEGTAPCKRSRIMVIGPAGVGKTSLIRRLTGQEFDKDEASTVGTEENVVTKSTVSSWEVVKDDTHKAKDEMIRSIAMHPNVQNFNPSKSSDRRLAEGSRITGTKGVVGPGILETPSTSLQRKKTADAVTSINQDKDRIQETPSTSLQRKKTTDAVTSIKQDKEKISDKGDTGQIDLKETKNKEEKLAMNNQSTSGKGRKSEASKDSVSTKVNVELEGKSSPINENEKIATISKRITREEITNVTAHEITYSIWDFGGQEIYYITHPLFLSWRSLYILVIPLNLELSARAPREDDVERAPLKGSAPRTHRTILDLIHFWLMSIYTHAVPPAPLDSRYEPKILVIGTFADAGGSRISKEKVESKVKELEELISSKPYRDQVILIPICVIENSSSKRPEVNEIQDRIDDLISNSEYMKAQMPIRWRACLLEIEDKNENTLTLEKARLRMHAFGIDGKEVNLVLQFYHDIGHLVYHQGCELIVLKPQFLNSIVSNIITVIDDAKLQGNLAKHWTDLKDKGLLNVELIQAVWEDHEGDHAQLDGIIDMMIKFDLICEIPDRANGKRQFFVPCRSSPMLHEKEKHDKGDTVEFTIDFHHFLPDGFLHRFYVRMARWSMERKKRLKPTFHCRQMVFYIDSGHRVVMTNEINSKRRHQIKVTIYAVTPYGAPPTRPKAKVNLDEKVIDYIIDTLEDLKKTWARRIEYSVGILCPRCEENDDIELILIKEILKDQEETACCAQGCIDEIWVGNILQAFNKDIGHSTPSTSVPSESIGRSDPAGQAAAAISSRESNSIEASDSCTVIGNTTINRQTNISDAVPEDKLNTLATHVPHGKYTDLANRLGISFTPAGNILSKHGQDSMKAIRECLAIWKDRTGGSKAELKEILITAEIGALVEHI